MSDHLLPPRLRPGARLAAVTLSWGGPGAYPHRYEAGVQQLEEAFGVEVVPTAHALAAPEVIAAHPQLRVDDLHAAFADPSVDGIVSTIGGDDSIRLLPLLDLDVIAANPKVFLGFSDTTITHLACQRAGVVSFYGPSLMAGFAENGGLHDYLVDGVRRMLFDPVVPTEWPVNRAGWTAEHLDWADPGNQTRRRALQPAPGPRWLGGADVREGPLLPACADVLPWLRGSPWWPDLDGAVLALETSEEAPSPAAVARFLRVLALTDELSRLAALLLARPGGVDAAPHEAYDEAVLRVVRHEQGLADLPVVTGLDFGHTDPIWTLPVGVRVRVDQVARSITFVEPWLRD